MASSLCAFVNICEARTAGKCICLHSTSGSSPGWSCNRPARGSGRAPWQRERGRKQAAGRQSTSLPTVADTDPDAKGGHVDDVGTRSRMTLALPSANYTHAHGTLWRGPARPRDHPRKAGGTTVEPICPSAPRSRQVIRSSVDPPLPIRAPAPMLATPAIGSPPTWNPDAEPQGRHRYATPFDRSNSLATLVPTPARIFAQGPLSCTRIPLRRWSGLTSSRRRASTIASRGSF